MCVRLIFLAIGLYSIRKFHFIEVELEVIYKFLLSVTMFTFHIMIQSDTTDAANGLVPDGFQAMSHIYNDIHFREITCIICHYRMCTHRQIDG